MEKEFQTSFIPKKPLAEERAPERNRPTGIVFLLSLLVFVASAVFGGGVYLYRSYLEKRIVSMEESLRLAEGEFERGVIDELELLERRLNAAGEILSAHVSISPVFRVLEDVTLPTVRFTSFSYGKDETNPNLFLVDLKGEATSYTQIALQSDLLGKNKNLKNPIFSDLTLGDKGTVSFNLSFSLDPSFVLYERALIISGSQQSASAAPSLVPEAGTAATAPAGIDLDLELESIEAELTSPSL